MPDRITLELAVAFGANGCFPVRIGRIVGFVLEIQQSKTSLTANSAFEVLVVRAAPAWMSKSTFVVVHCLHGDCQRFAICQRLSDSSIA